ncbi:unnamed protein product, partial [Allacma fusca]
MSESQAAYRRGRSCNDHLIVLNTLVQKSIARRKRLYCLFVDLSKAFDSIKREKLWTRLGEIGLDIQMIQKIREIYNHAYAKVQSKQGYTQPLRILNGVLQGETLSPTLFTLFIDEITLLLQKSNINGARIAATKAMILLYADDIILTADCPHDLQSQINIIAKFFKNNDLLVNMDKTKIVVFGSGKQQKQHRFYNDGNKIEIVNSYKYLGVEFHKTGSFKEHHDAVLHKTNVAINTLVNILKAAKIQDIDIAIRLFNTLAGTIPLYGLPIWGMNYVDNMEKLQTKFLRQLLGASNLTPGYVLRLETGCKSIKSQIMKAILTTMSNTMYSGTPTKEAKDCLNYLKSSVKQHQSTNMYIQWRKLFQK